jgi:hypothetical protein
VTASDEFSTTAKVLLVLVSLVPAGLAVMWFKVAATDRRRRTIAVARGVLWVLFAVGFAVGALGVHAALYLMIIATALLFSLSLISRRRPRIPADTR